MAEISIDLRADPDAFAAGTKAAESAMEEWVDAAESGADDVAEKLEQVIREMVKLGTSTGRTKDQMVRDLRAFGLSAEQAEDAVEAVWREMGDGQRAVRTVEDAADAYKDLERGAGDAEGATDRVGDATGRVGEGFDELGQIARDVLAGDMAGAAESAVGALGGLASTLTGPVGLGLGGLAIIAGTVATAWATRAEEIKANWQAMYDDMVESGAGFLSQDLINQKIQEIAGDQGKVNAAMDEGRTAGENYLTIIRAQAGDLDALSSVISSARDRLNEQNAAQEAYIAKNGEESAAIADKQGALEILIGKYERMLTAQNGAATAAETARRAMEASTAANNRNAGSLEAVRLAAANLPASKTVKVTADTAAVFAEFERIRRQKLSVSVGIEYYGNQHRGTFVP